MSAALRIPTAVLVAALAFLLGCATRVQVPPRIDLARWTTIGVVDFAGSDPGLAQAATGEFLEMLHDAQPGVRILELGSEGRLLAELGRDQLDFETVRAIGQRYQVGAVFEGSLELGAVKPSVRLGRGFASVRAAADVDGQLVAKLLETDSGAVVWSRRSQASAAVARVGLPGAGGVPKVRVGDPDAAHAGLVPKLVWGMSRDFYPTWQKQ